jgi:hypothetical protein
MRLWQLATFLFPNSYQRAQSSDLSTLIRVQVCTIKQRLFIFSFSNFVRLLHPWPCASAVSAESGPPLSLCSCLCWAVLASGSDTSFRCHPRQSYQACSAVAVPLQRRPAAAGSASAGSLGNQVAANPAMSC